jgi:hypothetical protein
MPVVVAVVHPLSDQEAPVAVAQEQTTLLRLLAAQTTQAAVVAADLILNQLVPVVQV